MTYEAERVAEVQVPRMRMNAEKTPSSEQLRVR